MVIENQIRQSLLSPKATNIKAWGAASKASGTPGRSINVNPSLKATN
jgi:hypothetical protein